MQPYKNRHGIVVLDGHENKKQKAKRVYPPCVLCGTRENITMHHRKPKVAGGDNTKTNLVALCLPCHRRVHQEDEEIAATLGLKIGEYYRWIYAFKV